jgi:hypothetical protein
MIIQQEMEKQDLLWIKEEQSALPRLQKNPNEKSARLKMTLITLKGIRFLKNSHLKYI